MHATFTRPNAGMSAKVGRSAGEKALEYVRRSQRVGFGVLRDNPGARTQGRVVSKKDNRAGKSQKEISQAAKPPLGWVWGDWYKPWQRVFPSEPLFNKGVHLKREYPPLSLLELQRLIDLGWIDVEQPIDLTSLCGSRRYRCRPILNQFGVWLTADGADAFKAKVNIEVQWANEPVIAAIERNGGTVTTAYFDPRSLELLVNPMEFLNKGEPIPKRLFPPADVIEYYVDAKNRGYLANPADIADAKLELAQKYGYEPKNQDQEQLAVMKKKPLQIFYGLEPGWLVNLRDRNIRRPCDHQLQDYYTDKVST